MQMLFKEEDGWQQLPLLRFIAADASIVVKLLAQPLLLLLLLLQVKL
jgi:hypothetical protein